MVASFKYIEDYMNQNCHPNTTLGAALHGDGLLTDHGVEHVKMVIQNAGKLVGDMQYKRLNGYEIYLLLLAIHFHDVGNVCGRQEHEKKIDDIIIGVFADKFSQLIFTLIVVCKPPNPPKSGQSITRK